jgi:hypothetical protein
VIDIATEKLYPLLTAINMVFNRKISAATAWRWVHRGIRGRKLEVVRLGQKTYVSLESLARFAEQHGAADAPTTRTPRQREQAIRKAERELADVGL